MTPDDFRCEIHDTALTNDAIRGPVCVQCDSDAERIIVSEWPTIVAAVGLLLLLALWSAQ